jgi:hypothetical protein
MNITTLMVPAPLAAGLFSSSHRCGAGPVDSLRLSASAVAAASAAAAAAAAAAADAARPG